MPTKPGHITPERAREINAQRKHNGAGPGRPRILKTCPKCNVGPMSARELWAHRC
jgi:hypothetical protein